MKMVPGVFWRVGAWLGAVADSNLRCLSVCPPCWSNFENCCSFLVRQLSSHSPTQNLFLPLGVSSQGYHWIAEKSFPSLLRAATAVSHLRYPDSLRSAYSAGVCEVGLRLGRGDLEGCQGHLYSEGHRQG